MSDDDYQELWQEIGKPEAAEPTPAQLLTYMRLCDDAVGVDLARRMLDTAARASHCFVMGHDGLLEELRWTQRHLAEANRQLDLVDAWIKGDDNTGESA